MGLIGFVNFNGAHQAYRAYRAHDAPKNASVRNGRDRLNKVCKNIFQNFIKPIKPNANC